MPTLHCAAVVTALLILMPLSVEAVAQTPEGLVEVREGGRRGFWLGVGVGAGGESYWEERSSPGSTRTAPRSNRSAAPCSSPSSILSLLLASTSRAGSASAAMRSSLRTDSIPVIPGSPG